MMCKKYDELLLNIYITINNSVVALVANRQPPLHHLVQPPDWVPLRPPLLLWLLLPQLLPHLLLLLPHQVKCRHYVLVPGQLTIKRNKLNVPLFSFGFLTTCFLCSLCSDPTGPSFCWKPRLPPAHPAQWPSEHPRHHECASSVGCSGRSGWVYRTHHQIIGWFELPREQI